MRMNLNQVHHVAADLVCQLYSNNTITSPSQADAWQESLSSAEWCLASRNYTDAVELLGTAESAYQRYISMKS
jgi:hypothetical protein